MLVIAPPVCSLIWVVWYSNGPGKASNSHPKSEPQNSRPLAVSCAGISTFTTCPGITLSSRVVVRQRPSLRRRHPIDLSVGGNSSERARAIGTRWEVRHAPRAHASGGKQESADRLPRLARWTRSRSRTGFLRAPRLRDRRQSGACRHDVKSSAWLASLGLSDRIPGCDYAAHDDPPAHAAAAAERPEQGLSGQLREVATRRGWVERLPPPPPPPEPPPQQGIPADPPG